MPAAAAITTKPTLRDRTILLTLADGASVAPPDFGVPVPPDEIRTKRVVKDILRVGKWKTGYDQTGKALFWDVTPQTLAQIAADFQAMKANGVGSNLGKTHGDENLLIHPDDLIAPIDGLKVVGDTLFMATYVSPEDEAYLKNPARKVSVGVIPNHTDGTGNKYKLYLTHVAVTDRPVMAGQGPFMTLAEAGRSSSMNQDLLDAINMLMEAAGLSKLGEVADETDLVSQLKGVAAALGKKASAETPEAPEAPEAPVGDMGSMDLSQLPKPLADFVRKQEATMKTLADQLASERKARVDEAKATFKTKAAELVKAGVTKAVIDGKLALADRLNCYDVALLDGLTPTLNMGSGGHARKLADASEPKLPGGGDDAEERRQKIAADIAKRRGIKLEDALKLVP